MVRSFLAPPLIVVSLAGVLFAGPQETGEAIDTQRSSITIHVGKSGVFAGWRTSTGPMRLSQRVWLTSPRRTAEQSLGVGQVSRNRVSFNARATPR